MTKRRTMIGMALGLGALASAVCALNGCDRKPKPQAKTDRPPATVAPLAFAKSDADSTVTLTLPEPIKLFPELHTQIYNDGQQKLLDFMAQAHKGRAEEKAEGMDVPAYSQTIAWQISAQSPRLLSLYAEESDFSGGAHPTSSFQTLVYDKTKKDLINGSALFANGADMKAIDAYLCHQIEAERSRRLEQPTTQAASGLPCPHLADSKLILIPSTLSGHIGAIDALYAPYEVGAYVEGPYEIRVPQTLLKPVLSPEFADQFGGDPVKDNALDNSPATAADQ